MGFLFDDAKIRNLFDWFQFWQPLLRFAKSRSLGLFDGWNFITLCLYTFHSLFEEAEACDGGQHAFDVVLRRGAPVEAQAVEHLRRVVVLAVHHG